MSDSQTNINQPGEQSNQGHIMKELSDIKSTLAVNTSEVQNIKGSITEIKEDIKDIKTRYITWEQHKDVVNCNEKQQKEIEELKSFKDTLNGKMWGIGATAGAVAGVLSLLIDYFLRVH